MIGIQDEAAEIRRAVGRLHGGGVVGLPTDEGYFLAVDAEEPLAVRVLRERAATWSGVHLQLLLPHDGAWRRWTRELPHDALRLVAAFTPGPLTLELPASTDLFEAGAAAPGFVRISVPDHPSTATVLRHFGRAVAVVPADASREVAGGARHVRLATRRPPDFVLSSGPDPAFVPNTVVRFCGSRAEVVQEGALGRSAIQRALGGLDPGICR